MPYTFASDKKEREEAIRNIHYTYSTLKQIGISLEYAIESLNTFHRILGDIIKKIRDADPTIVDDVSDSRSKNWIKMIRLHLIVK